VLHRDVQILESLGATVPSATMDQFNTVYLASFAQGAPTAADLPRLRSNLLAILGPAETAARIASTDRLVVDAPAFLQAAGASSSHVQTIVQDVGALVDAGGGEPPNPFKVTVPAGPGGGRT
jgi:hypothetical protein